MIDIDRGDFLIFGAIGWSLGLQVSWDTLRRCEVEPGIWRRHPEIGERSRSDISRDGYMGVVFMALAKDMPDVLERIRKAGWKRGWTMGDRGHWDYTNMAPLVPILYAARYGRWIPTIPTLCTKFNNRGFRAHLLALAILIEHLIGKRRWSHKQGARGIAKKNPANPWFAALDDLVHSRKSSVHLVDIVNLEKSYYSWGGCPGLVFRELVRFTINLQRES